MCHHDFALHLMPQIQAWCVAKIQEAFRNGDITIMPIMRKGKAGLRIWADCIHTDTGLDCFKTLESTFRYFLNGEEAWTTKKKFVQQLETIVKKLKQEIATEETAANEAFKAP